MPKRKAPTIENESEHEVSSITNNEREDVQPSKNKKPKISRVETTKSTFSQNQQTIPSEAPIQKEEQSLSSSSAKHAEPTSNSTTSIPSAIIHSQQPKSEVSKFLDSLELSQLSAKFESEGIQMKILDNLQPNVELYFLRGFGLNEDQSTKIIEALNKRKKLIPQEKLELNWSDAKSFLESLHQIAKQNGLQVKKDFTVPHSTLMPTMKKLKFSPVQSTERDFWTQVAAILPNKRTNDRNFHPMFALWAGPGLGKTWTLNHLASMPRDRIDSVITKYNEDQKLHNKAVVSPIDCPFAFVQIDFNGSCPFQKAESDDPFMALDLRFLFSAFFDQSTSFNAIQEAFMSTFADVNVVTRLEKLVQFFHEILDEHKKGRHQIVIAIDEISRAESTKATTQELLDRCNHIMNIQNYLWVVASALENTALISIRIGKEKSKTPSGRPIAFFTPHRPSMSERLALFSEYTGVKDLNLLLLYSGGHWRTLLVINELMHKHWTMAELILIYTDRRLLNSPQLSSAVWTTLVGLALRAKQVSADFILENGSKMTPPSTSDVTIGNAISQAPLLNSLTTVEPLFVPRLSILQLMTWQTQVQNDSQNTLYLPVTNLLNEYDQLRNSPTHGHRFERFHALWEVLQNRLDSTAPLSIVQKVWEHVNQLFDPKNFARPKLTKKQLIHLQKLQSKLSKFLGHEFVSFVKNMFDLKEIISQTEETEFTKRSVKNNFDVINRIIDQDDEFKKKIAGSTEVTNSTNQLDEKARMDLWENSIRFKYVFLLPTTYPDIDIVSFFKSKTNGEVFAIIEQLKYPYSTESKFKYEEICSRKQALESLEMLFPNHGIPTSNILFAIVAWKNFKPDVAVKLLSPNIERMKRANPLEDFPDRYHADIVAGLPELRKSYGPTLESVGWLLGAEPTMPLVAGSFVTKVLRPTPQNQ